MVTLVRDHCAGKLELFAPSGKPGRPAGVAPTKDRARGRVIELRREGLFSYEISARLAGEGIGLLITTLAYSRIGPRRSRATRSGHGTRRLAWTRTS